MKFNLNRIAGPKASYPIHVGHKGSDNEKSSPENVYLSQPTPDSFAPPSDKGSEGHLENPGSPS
jgi:hypothetical protein